MSISTLIKTIQDIMRKDVGVDGDAQRIGQIVWLLFLKIFDDKESEWELTVKGYKSPLQDKFRWRNWAKNPEGMTGEELIDFVNNQLFPALKKLATHEGVNPYGKVVGSVFEDAFNYMKSGTLLRQVINTIQEDVDFNSSSDRHLFNDIYEKILSDLQSAGNAGEYYTPRAVTQFMVDIINPKIGETILDPACGTGGFLTCTIEHLKKQVKNNVDKKKLQQSVWGVEKKPLPHMLAMTNVMLHGIDVPDNIKHDNTLSRPLKDYGSKDRVDVVLTNPPFGGMEENGIEKNFPKNYQTRETADLFMALIMHLLKQDTGRAAVVLPDGFLLGEGVKTTLKRELLTDFNLHTIVRLPKGVFSPYTNIATNILFFEKGRPTKDVWFFEHPYPEGYKSYSKTKPLTIEEFNLEKEWWGGETRKGRKENKHAWKISVEELEERDFNFDCKNPHHESVPQGDIDDLMGIYDQVCEKINTVHGKIKTEIMRAIGKTENSIEPYYDVAFSGSDGTKKLREFILSLAMAGKLVKQDPTDTPASQLLKEYSKEIEAKVKVGESKTLKPMPKITDKDIPYALPSGWEWVRLGDIGFTNIGLTYKPSDVSDKGIPVLRSNNIQNGLLDLSDLKRVSLKVKESVLIENGDLLICARNGSRALVGKTAMIKGITEPMAFGAFMAIFRSKFNNYILYFINSALFRRVIDEVNTMTINQITQENLKNTICPLPPLKEQQRIINKIESLFDLCREFETLMLEKDKLRISIRQQSLHVFLA